MIIELLSLPLLYQAYYTAVLFSALNAYLLLKLRIPIEEQALREATNYQEVMEGKRRLLPSLKDR